MTKRNKKQEFDYYINGGFSYPESTYDKKSNIYNSLTDFSGFETYYGDIHFCKHSSLKHRVICKSRKLKTFIYDKENGLVLNSAPIEWVKRIAFFIIFYASLAVFSIAIISPVFYFHIMNDYPARTGMNSLLQLNPGLSVVPQPDRLTTLIRFTVGKKYSYRKYVDDLIAFTQYYEDHGLEVEHKENTITDYVENCWDTGGRSNYDDDRMSCHVLLNMGGRCNIFQEFGYDEGMPCVIVKLNRLYGWLPDPVNDTAGVGIKCEGISDIDKDHIGPLCYYDDDTINKPEGNCKHNMGVIKSYYFPYLKQLSYQSPFVYVEFVDPKKFVVIMVECYAIANNIRLDWNDGGGRVKFEIFVD